jgi:hypothetical protein
MTDAPLASMRAISMASREEIPGAIADGGAPSAARRDAVDDLAAAPAGVIVAEAAGSLRSLDV